MGPWLVFEELTNQKTWMCLDALGTLFSLSTISSLSQVGQRPGYYIPQTQQPPALIAFLFLSSISVIHGRPEMLPVLATLQLPGSCLLYGPTG